MKQLAFCNDTSTMLNRIVAAQVSDTTEDDSSTTLVTKLKKTLFNIVSFLIIMFLY